MPAVLLALCIAFACGTSSLNAQDMLVMQYNIQKALGKISYNTNEQAKALGRIVNYLQPDVILINELQTTIVFSNELALVDWVTNNLPYMGTQKNVSFFISVSGQTDNFNRNAAISLYPISNGVTYDDDLRGLHSFRVQFPGTNEVQFFHTHLKSGNTTNSMPTDAERRQAEAQFDADIIGTRARRGLE
jgi:endonuclease/exonuclease/phosphatase family metal-dependent hydrolase